MDLEIYERIKELRKNHLHMSQESFGARLGVSRSVINNIERNALQRPEQKEPIYKLICKEFNVSYLWLTQGIEPMENESDYTSMAQIDDIMAGENETAKSIFKAFARLDEKEWALLARIIKDISKDI